MNLLEHYVTKILGEPVERNGYWTLEIEYECYGHKGIEHHFFKTKEEALAMKIGDKFMG
jgi:hypothetical protein